MTFDKCVKVNVECGFEIKDCGKCEKIEELQRRNEELEEEVIFYKNQLAQRE